jgi:endonuclease YncB( thermonuclease family)
MTRLALALCALVVWHGALAEQLIGKVVQVQDGDTLTVRDSAETEHKIRLNGIDAPEGAQPFGDASTQSLSALTYGKTVEVEYRKKDRNEG